MPSALQLLLLVFMLFSSQVLAVFIIPQGDPVSCQPYYFKVGGGQGPYTIHIQVIDGADNDPIETVIVSEATNAGWFCDIMAGGTFSASVTDAAGNSATAPTDRRVGGTGNGDCVAVVVNDPPSSQANSPVTTQAIATQAQTPVVQSSAAQFPVAQTQQTPTSTSGAGNAGAGAGMVTITTPQAAPSPTVAPDSSDLAGNIIPTVCLKPCNAYQAAAAKCVGLDPVTLHNEGADVNSTEATCVCTNSLAVNVATCGTCIAQNPDSATTLKPDSIINGINTICAYWLTSSNGQSSWKNMTYAYSGGLNGQGASIPGGSNVISKISAGAISVYGDVTGFGIGIGSQAGAMGKSVYGDATGEVGKVTAGVAAAGQAAASGVKGVGNAIGSIFSASPKLEISIFLPVATTVICLGIYGGAALLL